MAALTNAPHAALTIGAIEKSKTSLSRFGGSGTPGAIQSGYTSRVYPITWRKMAIRRKPVDQTVC
jgi:hypothetical protein